MSKKVLLTATVQSHIYQFHKPLIDLLHENGYEVHVAAKDNLHLKNGIKLDFVEKIYNVPFSRSPFNKDNITAYKQLKIILRKEDYDIVHCNTPMGGVLTRLAARNLRAKGLKVFYTAHGFHFYKGASFMSWATYYPIEKILSSITDKLITINSEDYAFAQRTMNCSVYHIHGVGVDGEKYFPISTEEAIRLRKVFGFTAEQKIVLCIGELLPNKNQTMAIDAMKQVCQKYPDAILLLAGNGPRQQFLEHYIEEANLQGNVRMLGYVTNLPLYQGMADVLLACSFREGLPLNLIEAMLSGNPVVASENRGHCELVVENFTGYLVKPNDSAGMATRLLDILDNETQKETLSHNAMKRAALYTFASVKQELKHIYGF